MSTMELNKCYLNQESISCSICLDLLKDPVTIPCGHSYCMNCIKGHWDAENRKKIHSCPQCRQNFTSRPVLVKSTTLAELVEELKKTGLEDPPADHCYVGPGDVACDVCTERKLKAVKSCLVCLVSYCEKHLERHYSVKQLMKHKLVEPLEKLQENICSQHDEVMELFCRTDQQRVCYLCSVEEHKDHETVSSAEERAEKQKKLEVSRQEIQQRIQDREEDVKLLQQELEAINVSAKDTVKDSDKIFKELIRLIKSKRSAVKQQVRSQQETEVSRVKELQEKLEQEITELKRKDQQLEQLSNTEDHNQFLHNYPSESELRESPDSSSIKTRPLRYFQDVTVAVSDLKDTVKNIVEDKWTNISVAATEVDILLLEPISRAEFLKRSQDLTFDPNTANKELLLSPDNKKVTFLRENQSYSDHPDRFTHFCQVLSEESLTGRRYWEVEWQGGGVCVSAAYRDIKREGSSAECAFGFNDLSWALSSTTKGYKFDHGKDETVIAGPRSSRIGVYLDHRAGVLCFYSVSETMTLLHRVQTTFTQPLHAGVRFYVSKGDAAEFIQPK